MPTRTSASQERVIVIGGSQGAIETLREIIRGLPQNFPAAVFVVVHTSVDADGYLPKILSRGPLPAIHPHDGMKFSAGRIYVAPPDHHMTLESKTILVRRGPRENRHRPAIDPLFRTALRSFGAAVIGVVLSGNLDDGSAGLLAVRGRGGIGIVQDPGTALVGEMPYRALQYAGADDVLPAGEIAGKLVELVSTNRMKKKTKSKQFADSENKEIRKHEHDTFSGQGGGKPSVFACPECHGVLWEVKEGKLVQYRCRVGHAFSANSLKAELDQSAERAMWAAMRALEEKAAMSRRLLASAKGPKGYIDRLKDQAEGETENAHIIRTMIFSNK